MSRWQGDDIADEAGGFPEWEDEGFSEPSAAPRWARVVAKAVAVIMLAPLLIGLVITVGGAIVR